MVEDEAVVFGQVDVEEEGIGLDDVDGDAGLGGEALVAEEAVAAEGEGDGLGRLEHEGVGAAVAAGGDGDLGFGAAGDGHCADVGGCEVGHVGGEDEEFGCAVGGGVAGGLGEGGVELWFGLGVVGGAGLAFFGQGAAAGAFGRGQGVGVAADDEDFGVEVGLVDAVRVRVRSSRLRARRCWGEMWAARRLLPSLKGLTGTTTQRPGLLCALFAILVPGPICRGVAVTQAVAELQDLGGQATVWRAGRSLWCLLSEPGRGRRDCSALVLVVEDESVEEVGVVFDDC